MDRVVSANKVFEQYLGKEVFVVMKDNYKKKGKLIAAGSNFITLWYLSGLQETISVDQIKSIRPR